MHNHRLFTTANPKTRKGEPLGYYTAVLHLAPADTAGVGNICPMATAGCKAACLNTAGRGAFDNVQAARIRKTREYMRDRDGFTAKLAEEIAWHHRKAERQGLKLAVRVNGTSDLPALARNLARRFPDVQFYDYTKLAGAVLSATSLPNLHYTFSHSERGGAEHAARAQGVNVAVVFNTRKGEPMPATWNGRPVIDGDEHDLRFLDPRGVVVGLRAKGRAKKDTTGFVVRVAA